MPSYKLEITKQADLQSFSSPRWFDSPNYVVALRCDDTKTTETLNFRIEYTRLVIFSHLIEKDLGGEQSVFSTPNARWLWFLTLEQNPRYAAILGAIVGHYKDEMGNVHDVPWFELLQFGCSSLVNKKATVQLELPEIEPAAKVDSRFAVDTGNLNNNYKCKSRLLRA